MSDSNKILAEIVDSLKNSGSRYFPELSQPMAVRQVGHTPKAEYCTYEIVLDFEAGSERVNAKVYRGGKSGSPGAPALARNETQNLTLAYQSCSQSKRKLTGLPRPIGDFADLGAVVSTKIGGLPLQSIVMKAALLPDPGNHRLLQTAARQAGEWLRQFHTTMATAATPLDANGILADLEGLCIKAQKEGLPAESTAAILSNAGSTLTRQKKPTHASAVLNEFVPLNVLVAENGVGFCDFSGMQQQGNSLHDAAAFLAAVEALEKYPFCDRGITMPVQEAFMQGYGIEEQDQPVLTVLKMRVLLQMFAQGRTIQETAVRKKAMWANVMKRFIQQAAERSMVPAA